MAPLPDRPGALARPGPILAASPEGYIAWCRLSNSSRQGSIWSRPSDPPPSLPLQRYPADLIALQQCLPGIQGLLPYIAEWMRLKGPARRLRHGGLGEDGLRQTLQGLAKHSWDLESYLDGVPQKHILDVLATSGLSIPSPSAHSAARDEIDTYVLSLAKWFKSTYMRWIDPIPCPNCSGPTQAFGSADPTPAEMAEGGGRVELHMCKNNACRGIRRFVRYGAIGPLLRTREGRCGEWAHLFYAFLRVAGVEARYVWNSEAAVDKPLLYDKGWGKKQAYCLAFGPRGAEDVTAVYVTDHAECVVRRKARGWREKILALALEQYTISLLLQHPVEERETWEYMMQKQQEWKSDVKGRMKEAEEEELGGRVSGPEEWRKMRDELGEEHKIVRPSYTVKRDIHSLKSSDVYLFGDAKRSGPGVILTTGPSQTAAVFADIKVSQDQSFRSIVQFRMTAPPSAGEADGMAIVFSRERKLGLGGYGLGYHGLGSPGDFAVEIDTYRTQDHADDPPTPHISVQSPPHAHHRHSIACTRPGQIPFLSNGKKWELEMVYDGTKRKLSAWLNSLDEAEGNDNKDQVGLWQVDIPKGEANGEWHIGVTGSCGGLWQKQEILEWKIETIEIAYGPEIGGTDTEQI